MPWSPTSNPVHASGLQNAQHVVDGGHLLHSVMWPKEVQMPVTCSQPAFLGNHKNKARFISVLIASLTHSDIKCSQSQANADFLFCNSAIELAEETDCPVNLVGKDTDLLVMLTDLVQICICNIQTILFTAQALSDMLCHPMLETICLLHMQLQAVI